MSFYIKKASGEKELFVLKKFKNSLKKTGADEALIDEIAKKIEQIPGLRTTQEIYAYARDYLQQKNPPLAARYHIKRALHELGPSGFPFEQFIAKLFQEQGHTTQTDVHVSGACVSHEIDIIATRDTQHFIVECKFHNDLGIKVDVTVALYSKARFDDIEKAEKKKLSQSPKNHQAWIVSNAKFTSKAISYAECVGIQLLGWSYPVNNNIQQLIDALNLHPITALVSLTLAQKKALIQDGFILCRDARAHTNAFKKLGFSDEKIETLIKESEAVCRINT